jgi:hypothetical protein
MDSTGIKAEGEGEWKSRKHGGSKQRIWRKIQIGIDEETLEVRAVKVTTSNVGDAPFLPELLLRRSHPIRTSAASQPTVPTIPENATTRSLPVMPTPSSRAQERQAVETPQLRPQQGQTVPNGIARAVKVWKEPSSTDAASSKNGGFGGRAATAVLCSTQT